jgi:hypothetical protein
MNEKRVLISNGCCFVQTNYGGAESVKEVDLEYIERSSDHWHSDSETSVSITKEQAQEIIELLRDTFNI